MPINIHIDPIIPQPRFFPKKVMERIEREIERELKGEVKERTKREMQSYTKGWEHSVEFRGRYANYQGAVGSITVYPYGPNRKIWEYVSGGVKRRIIVTRNAKRLRVRYGYKPHTRPGGVKGGPGSYAGPTTYPTAVDWPGIKPREFERDIAERGIRFQNDIVSRIEKAIERAAR